MNNEDIRIVRRVNFLDSLDGFKPQNNFVLLKQVSDNLNTPTKGGLLKASKGYYKNQFLAMYVDRTHEVIAVPDKLVYQTPTNKTSGNTMRWKCDIEVEVGDTVITSYPSVLDYTSIVVGDTEYKLINYQELRVAQKATTEIVPLNGWVLYEHPQEHIDSTLIDPKDGKRPEKEKGVVVMAGKPNTEYMVQDAKTKKMSWRDLDSDIELKAGDVFYKANKAHQLVLEDPMFRIMFDRDIFCIQRKDILAVE